MRIYFRNFLVFFITSFIILQFFSCSSKTETSEKLIDKVVFEEILYKVHMADAKKDVYNAVSNKNDYLLPDYYQKEIFDSYKINMEIFTWNVVYYSVNNQMDVLYSSVIQRINQEKAELEKQKYKRIINKDRINKKSINKKSKIIQDSLVKSDKLK